MHASPPCTGGERGSSQHWEVRGKSSVQRLEMLSSKTFYHFIVTFSMLYCLPLSFNAIATLHP